MPRSKHKIPKMKSAYFEFNRPISDGEKKLATLVGQRHFVAVIYCKSFH